MSVAGLTTSPMRLARRARASRPSAKAIARSNVVSRSLVRAHGAMTSGRRSVKMRRAQEGTLQKNLRTRRVRFTG
jgi:hypothetical protein